MQTNVLNSTEVKGDVDEFGFPVVWRDPERVEVSRSLEAMVDGYVFVKGNFYARAPKLKQQRALSKLAKRIQEAAEDNDVILDAVLEMAQQILFVHTPLTSGGNDSTCFLAASPDEIEEEFDIAELSDLMKDYAGFGAGDEGKN